jgi:hypothetical protein
LRIGSIGFVDFIFVEGDSMPKILEDRKKALMKNNPKMSEKLAYAIATNQLKKSRKLKKKKRGG